MNHVKLRALAMQAQLALRPSETAYVASLRTVLGGLHAAMMATLLQHWRLKSGRLDAADRTSGLDLDAVELHFLKQVPGKVGIAFDRMAPRLVRDTKTTLIGIAPSDLGIPAQVEHAREQNIQLVERAGRAYAEDVRRVFEDIDNYGLSVDELKSLLMERGAVSAVRAELIARDQVLKLAGKLAQTRQQNAGIHDYLWSGVLDRRERESHVEMEGRKCSWAAPPQPVGYHPGQDYQCRCVPIPYVPELEGL